MAKRAGFLVIPLVIMVVISSNWGFAQYLDYLVPVYFVLHLLMVKSRIRFTLPAIIPIIVTGAFAYVFFCEDCSELKKSTIFTLWVSYFSALLSNTFLETPEPNPE